ncbi:hypothetical protein [Gloeothece verrucosa]|nr:hypothetical protein [Gloeothece verrucosa]
MAQEQPQPRQSNRGVSPVNTPLTTFDRRLLLHLQQQLSDLMGIFEQFER